MQVAGYEVLEAASVAEAHKRLAEDAGPPDVIVLDLVLADARGHELLTRIRQHPVLADVPVVLLAGRISDADRASLVRFGSNVLLPKPVNAPRLRQVVAQLASETSRSQSVSFPAPLPVPAI